MSKKLIYLTSFTLVLAVTVGTTRAATTFTNALGDNNFNDAGNWDKFRTQGLTFFMHVPSTHDPVDTFDEMMLAANTMAKNLGGKLTDQNHKALTDRGVHVIRKQISNIASDISSQGIYPGSEVALRLFE